MEIIGNRYGKLVVISRSNKPHHYWCECDCGKVVEKNEYHLSSGRVRSCGCLRKETSKNTMIGIRKENDSFKTNFSLLEKDRYKTKTPSGRIGVYKSPSGKWYATIYTSGRKIYLGTYEDKHDAIQARELAEVAYQLPLIEAKESWLHESAAV